MKLYTMLLVLAAAAYSQQITIRNCTTFLEDDGRAVLDVKRVNAAADQLRENGADVYVRVMSVPITAPTLDSYAEAYVRQCANWRGTNGKMKNNIIAIFVATADHRVGLYYGVEWKPMLDGKWTWVRGYSMTPAFKTGEYDRGIASGLAKLAELTKPQNAGMPTWIWISLGIALLLGAGFGLIMWMSLREKKEREDAERLASILRPDLEERAASYAESGYTSPRMRKDAEATPEPVDAPTGRLTPSQPALQNIPIPRTPETEDVIRRFHQPPYNPPRYDLYNEPGVDLFTMSTLLENQRLRDENDRLEEAEHSVPSPIWTPPPSPPRRDPDPEPEPDTSSSYSGGDSSWSSSDSSSSDSSWGSSDSGSSFDSGSSDSGISGGDSGW